MPPESKKRKFDDTPEEKALPDKRPRKTVQRFGAAPLRTLTDGEFLKLGEDIRQETKAGLPGWGGAGTPIARYENPVTKDNKRKVRDQGSQHGCHTCLTMLTVDRTQPWVGDHIPPTNLPLKFEQMLRESYPKMFGGTVLYPQCDLCASEQSALVKAIIAESATKWADRIAALKGTKAEKLLTGGRPHVGNSVPSYGPKVNASQSQNVQVFGRKKGCHSCASDLPASKYHADHCPPVVMHEPSTDAICAKLKISFPVYEARPQCPKCSHQQGGRMSRIKEALGRAADTLGMPNYWRS